MRIGVARETKLAERRVALTPSGAQELVAAGHEVVVERGAGVGAGHPDAAYLRAGARIEPQTRSIWSASELLLKVKEPVADEYPLLHEKLVLFTYLHLAADAALARALTDCGCTAIAYETVEDSRGGLPLLAPMSEVAGRLATGAAAYFLQAPLGGPGILIGGVAGVAGARVTIIGGGVVGLNAAQIAVGMQAEVTVLERAPDRLRSLKEHFGASARVLMSDQSTLEQALRSSDVVIGAVLVPGAHAPQLVTREMLGLLRPGSLVIDVAIDQGGCFETSRPTTHANPIYETDGIVHYCVANMPGAVPISSTRALTNATLPYVIGLAAGVEEALAESPGLLAGLNVRGGSIVHPSVADALGERLAA
jgi:alanine dehydrogenase